MIVSNVNAPIISLMFIADESFCSIFSFKFLRKTSKFSSIQYLTLRNLPELNVGDTIARKRFHLSSLAENRKLSHTGSLISKFFDWREKPNYHQEKDKQKHYSLDD